MTPLAPAGVPALVERLRAAHLVWRGVPLDRRVMLLDRASGLWLDDRERLSEAADAVARNTGYAATMVRECLARTFAAWHGAGLREVFAEARAALAPSVTGAVAHAPSLVVAVLAQNTPGLAIAPAFSALALGSALAIKSSSGEDAFAPRLAGSFAEIAPDLGRACAALAWPGGEAAIEAPLFAAADRVLVFGPETAVAAVRAKAGDRAVVRGPRTSLAVVGRVEPGPDGTAARLARGIAFLDQRGCLSPQAVLVAPGVDAAALGRDLASSLRDLEREWPRRRLDLEEAGAFRRAVDETEAAVIAGKTAALHGGGPGEPWAVTVEHAGPLRASPLDRFVRLHPFEGPAGLRAALAPLRGALECIGFEAEADERHSWEEVCREAGASRLCPVGRMQDPPATWHASGRRPLDDLLAWTVAEVDEGRAGVESGPERREVFLRHVAQTSDAPRAIEVASAAGCWIHDTAGRAWLDLLAGIGVASIGHGRAEVARAVARQAARYTHVMVYGEDVIEPQVELARRLAQHLPAALGVIYFTNSGAEGIEGALKLVRKATGRERVLSFEGAFHGDTTGALALGGNPVYREPFRPLLPGLAQIPWNDRAALERIDRDIAAVFAEPVQAEAGVRVPDPGFLPALRERCREVGALLVLDEVVTGLGRTGRWFGFEHWPGAEPDVIVLAKSLGGGLPLGAFAASTELMSVLSHDPPLGHVTTFGGNPVCCAAALAALDVAEREDLPARAARVGRELLTALDTRVGRGGLREVRGLGLLLGLEFDSASSTVDFVERCREQGLLLGWTLHRDRVVRIAPPLVIDENEVAIALRAIDAALGADA